ncbi:MAG: hypothetical protein ABI333_19410 [bacterium]
MTDSSSSTGQGKGYAGPDRRKQLPTMELWQENIKSLNQNNLTGCQMRYAFTDGKLTFLVRFEDAIPAGKLDLIFPELEHKLLVEEGWTKFILTITINDEGKLAIEMRGQYERDGVPLDVKLVFTRDIGLGLGIESDTISITDTRTAETVNTTVTAIIDDKLKDGERRYARKNDEVTSISVEGMIAILSRFLKQHAVANRVLKK